MKKFKKPTTLRTRIKKLVSDLNDNFRSIGEEFDGVHQRIDEFNQFKKEFYELRDEIATNGVATSINKLNAEVFDKKTDGDTSAFNRVMYTMSGAEPAQKVTLSGKFDAVIEHLGIDVSVKPREVIESKIVTKKVKTAKKGKK